MKAIGALSLAALLALAVAPTANASGVQKDGDCYYLLVQDRSFQLVCEPDVDVPGLIQEVRDLVEDRIPDDEVDPGFVGGCLYTDRQDTWEDPVLCVDVNADEVCARTGSGGWVCVPTDTPCVTLQCVAGCADVADCTPDVPPTPPVNATHFPALTVPVAYQERTVGHSTFVAERSVTVPTVTVLPARDPTPVGTTPAVGGRTCTPFEFVCANLPPVLGPTPVVVPGTPAVVVPGQTVTVGGSNVGAFVTVGAGATVFVPGGSVGPYSVAGIVDLCNRGCPWPGVPVVDVDHEADPDLLLP